MVAVAECCIAPRSTRGVTLNLEADGLDANALLFGEDATRVVVTCSPENEKAVRDASSLAGIRATLLGRVGGDTLAVTLDGRPCMDLAVSQIRTAWENGLKAVVG